MLDKSRRPDWETRSSILDSSTFRTENELLSSGGEISETGDRKIFVVEIGVVAEDLVGLHITSTPARRNVGEYLPS
jgi:hypothetical protein